MALPAKLKHMNLFNDGSSYVGQVEEITLPTLTRVMEDYRGGGMNAPIGTDQGMEALTMEWTCGGLMDEPLRQFGITQHDGVLLIFNGSYTAEDGSGIKAVEIEMRGRHSAIDMGTAKAAEGGTLKINSNLSYYRLNINGENIIEIDIINMIEIIDGVDRLKEHRTALGLS
jgi:P2 family phage contractile tail tube protein